ncbi:MAG: hypothetical protein KAT65_28615 [Methanophagales archaeon]|nr:hypothetical protein [Methanophagales archaeon]
MGERSENLTEDKPKIRNTKKSKLRIKFTIQFLGSSLFYVGSWNFK